MILMTAVVLEGRSKSAQWRGIMGVPPVGAGPGGRHKAAGRSRAFGPRSRRPHATRPKAIPPGRASVSASGSRVRCYRVDVEGNHLGQPVMLKPIPASASCLPDRLAGLP